MQAWLRNQWDKQRQWQQGRQYKMAPLLRSRHQRQQHLQMALPVRMRLAQMP